MKNIIQPKTMAIPNEICTAYSINNSDTEKAIFAALYTLHCKKVTLGWLHDGNKEAGIAVEFSKSGDNVYCILTAAIQKKQKYKIFAGKFLGKKEKDTAPFNFHKESPSSFVIVLTMVAFILLFNKDVARIAKPVYEFLDLPSRNLDDIERINPKLCSFAEVFDDFEKTCEIFTPQGNIESLPEAALHKYYPEKTLTGKFFFLSPQDSGSFSGITPIAVKKGGDNDVKSETLASNSEYTDEEKSLIPVMPLWYVDTPESNFAARMYQETNIHRMRNLMLRGPSSTGKTTMAKAIASKLGLPYVFVTCNQDTDSYALIGQPMYDRKGTVHYVDSPLIRGVRRGYLIEIQEPLVVAKQGVFTVLNALMDDTDAVALPTGEIIKRDPRALIVLTTNVDYVGCRKMNQSVLRRMDLVMDILPGSNDDTIARVMAATGETDKSLVERMVALQKSIQTYLEKEEITDGVCGVSELINWINAYHLTRDVISAATYTFTSKCSDDPTVRKYVTTQIETVFFSA